MKHYIRSYLREKEDKSICDEIIQRIKEMESLGMWDKEPIDLIIENSSNPVYLGCIDMSCNLSTRLFRLSLKFNIFYIKNDLNLLEASKEEATKYIIKQCVHEHRHYEQWCWAKERYDIEGVFRLGQYNNSHERKDNILEIDANEFTEGTYNHLDYIMNQIFKN